MKRKLDFAFCPSNHPASKTKNHTSVGRYVRSGHNKLGNPTNFLSMCIYSAWLLRLTNMSACLASFVRLQCSFIAKSFKCSTKISSTVLRQVF